MDEVELFKLIPKTQPRKHIFNELKSSKYPLTAELIYANLANKNINLSTIYRTLNTFYNLGILNKELNAKKEYAYSLNDKIDSHYLVCTKCNKKIKVKGCPYHDANSKLEKETGFKIINHKIEIYGICNDCQKDNKENEYEK
ncbi:MAG: Fur family transcriptional regulator [Bacillales bacterium]